MLTFRFSGAKGCMTVPEKLTSGMVGKRVRFEFSSDWDDLTKTAVYMAGDICRVNDGVGETDTIPAEVLARPMQRLYVGVCGTSADGTLVLPTVMVRGPEIALGADPLQAPAGEPPASSYARLLAMIGDLAELSTEAKDSLVAAINEIAQNSGSAQMDDATQLAMLIENDMLPAVHDTAGRILTDEAGRIVLRY